MLFSKSNPAIKTIILFALGAFGVLGFAPYYFYPASILSLIGVIYFITLSDSAKSAAISGFTYGLGLFSVGIYWIYISLHTYGGMPGIMAAFSTLVLAAFLALFPAAVGALSKKLGQQPSATIIAIPVLWALADWVRSWIFTGFPWLTIGYSQVPISPLAGYMPIIGVYGVTLITVLIASVIGVWLAHKPTPAWRRGALSAMLVIAATGYGLKQIAWTTPIGKPISVSLLQGNIEQNLKWAPELAERTMLQYLAMTEQSSAKLIVLPETALPVIASEVPDELKTRILAHAHKNQGDILVGMIERENGEYFNSVLSYGSAQTLTYRKSHLVPFGEFIPLKVAFGWIYRDWLNMPLSDLSRGAQYQQPMTVAGAKVAVNICYEDVFGEEIIRQLPMASLLVNVSNDAWYGESYAADQHLQFSQARALETGRMMLRATNTGATAIIDHKGYLAAHAPHFVQTSLDGYAQGYTGTTPYVYWGNWLFLSLCLGLLLYLWRRNRMSSR
ncbi:apolipoprotein N-acyltransferase [Methylotenera mobilis]|uniref:Apolipoprotein N-acyltransferase n=1 Tax=Methylotenera mobilis (strain JLW8 / ATCC BAA-1282 / DSM 17540) TaxID=583345 RepID=C6WXX6_METML|nr:apolipoprotein N-acyltransferase [Methylotenera mobilis]ACT48775.1 apolipoprotein N-acyltransferase [Methylotenera mobilis JLW8]